jgi:cytochrome P450
MSQITFDEAFFSDECIRDPIEPLAQLREQASVHYSQRLKAWVTLGWEDSRTVLRSRVTGKGDPLKAYAANLPPEDFERLHPLSDYTDRAIGHLDPPDHTGQRAAAMQVFDAGIGQRIEPQLRSAVSERIDELARGDSFEAIDDFSQPIAVAMISSLLGVKYDDRDLFIAWVERIFRYLGSPMNDPQLAQDCKEAYRSLGEYVAHLYAEAREAADPNPNTLIGMLVAPGATHGRTERDLMGMTVGMVQGGFETTTTLISNTIAALLQAPEQRARVQADSRLIPGAIEEVLRLDPSLKYASTRLAQTDVKLSDGIIRAGEVVQPVFIAANRDPAVFPEPNSFDVTRNPNPHLTFGLGIHFCIGAPLARMQARMAIEELFSRLPNIRLATDELVWRPSALLRRRESVPVLTHG